MQSTSTILMVRPAAFGYDPETALTNGFQRVSGLESAELQFRARAEFDHMVHLLDDKGVDVLVYNDSAHPVTPSAVFPNNWFSTHGGDTVVLYPMYHASRQAENDPNIFRMIENAGYRIDEYMDMTLYEGQRQALEGTGSLVLDRIHGQAFACISPRTDPELVETFSHEMDFFPITFRAFVGDQPIYHTNVMLAVGTGWTVLCTSAIPDLKERKRVIDGLDERGREIVEINAAQMGSFAGNMLEVRTRAGAPLIVLSEQAYGSLEGSQIQQLERHGELMPIPVPTIEMAGGGSVRCMIAELFLDKVR